MGRLKARSPSRRNPESEEPLDPRMHFSQRHLGALVEVLACEEDGEYHQGTWGINDSEEWMNYIDDLKYGWGIPDGKMTWLDHGEKGVIVGTGWNEAQGFGLRYFRVLFSKGMLWISPDYLKLIAESP